MGFTDWFTFRTKEQKQAKARQYARWACPYADAQVDETLNYPTPDALMAAGDELLQWLKAHKQAIKR